jgi:NADPH-dependent ferric siderophore reductase
MRRRLLDPMLLAARVERVDWIRPRMRHIALGGQALGGLRWSPGQQVRVQVAGRVAPLDWLTGLRRTYSVYGYDGSTLELCVFDHGDGPGARWARAARPGDEVLVSRPQGDFVLGPSEFHLFVGEETASVAFAAMAGALANPGAARAVIEVDTPADALPVAGDVRWVYRGGARADSSAGLLAAVRAADLPGRPGRAYLAGEARTIQLVRGHLVQERGWSRRDVLTKPFWTPGRTGME